MTTYPYAVTIHCQGKATVERVIAFNVQDAAMQAICQFVAAKEVAGESSEGMRVMRIEPDFTMVRRPDPDATSSDHLADAITGALTAFSRQAKEAKAK